MIYSGHLFVATNGLLTESPMNESFDQTGFDLVPPPASALVESLRGVGYSTPTAVADLIDNSISAGATVVHVRGLWAGRDTVISLLDDGQGMDGEELTNAMRLGWRNPLADRSTSDLGRFGLGLKTASFSQCRRLTVASRKNGKLSIRRWDLDHIARGDVNDWQLLRSPFPGSERFLDPLNAVHDGTMVLWEQLDRIVGNVSPDDRREHESFLALMDDVRDHLAMVFHQFLESHGQTSAFRIFLNGETEAHRVKPWDPFLRDHGATFTFPEEVFRSPDGTAVRMKGYVLPHKDRLDEKQFIRGGGPKGWTAQQGFYVYRNRRLLVAGSWLGLGHVRQWTQEEPYKLARIRLEIPNTADDEWKIDIKKSSARPPNRLRPRLRDLAENVRQQARKVFAYRGAYGNRAVVGGLEQVWLTRKRGDAATYRIDRNHPAVHAVAAECGGANGVLEALLRVVEETVPVQRIWLDSVENGEVDSGSFSEVPSMEVMDVMIAIYQNLRLIQGLSPQAARSQLARTEPFHRFPDLVNALSDDPADEREGKP